MLNNHRLLAVTAALAIGLTACGGSADDTAGEPTPSTTDEASEGATPSDPTTEDATDGPTDDGEPTDDMAEGDCSAAGIDVATPDFADVPEPTADAALFLLDAALRCDEQLLATAATESETRLTFGEADPNEFFGLPEPADEPYYSIIARLIAGTPYAIADGPDNIHVWPSVTTGRGTDADWDALVTSGLYTQEEMEQLRDSGDGYLGWRLGISGEGQWTFFVAGD